MAPNDRLNTIREDFFDYRLYRTIEFLEDAILIVGAVWHLIFLMTKPPQDVLLNPQMATVFIFIIYYLIKRIDVIDKGEFQKIVYLSVLVMLCTIAYLLGISEFIFSLYVVLIAKAVLLLHGKNVGYMCIVTCLLLSLTASIKRWLYSPEIGLERINFETFLAFFLVDLPYRPKDAIILILVALVVRTLVTARQQSVESERLSRELANMNADLERSRIAREIHDGVGNSLASLGVQLEVARKMIGKDLEKSTEALSLAENIARRCLRDVRNALMVMRVEEFDLNDAVTSLAAEIESGGKFKLATKLDVPSLQPALAYQIFRVIQESCTNALKHSTGDTIGLDVHSTNGTLFVEVNDNGQGLNNGTPSEIKGFGLLGIRERVEALHGNVEITSPPGMGITVKLQVPIDPSHPERTND